MDIKEIEVSVKKSEEQFEIWIQTNGDMTFQEFLAKYKNWSFIPTPCIFGPYGLHKKFDPFEI